MSVSRRSFFGILGAPFVVPSGQIAYKESKSMSDSVAVFLAGRDVSTSVYGLDLDGPGGVAVLHTYEPLGDGRLVVKVRGVVVWSAEMRRSTMASMDARVGDVVRYTQRYRVWA